MGLVGIHTVIVCEAHMHAKYSTTRRCGSIAMPPGNFEQLPSEIESEGIFSGLSPFNVPVDIVRCTKLFKC